MSASSHPMPAPSWSHLLAAASLSLAAVSGCTLLLGAVFLPSEALLLHPSQHVSVTHVLPSDGDHESVVLFWSIAERGAPGWRHHLSVAGVERLLQGDDQRPLEPLTIASVPASRQSIVGNWDGSLYLLDHDVPHGPPKLLGRQADGGVVDVACSPDGRFAISVNAFTLYGWDMVERRELWRRHDVRASCLAFGPGGATVFVGDSVGGLVELEMPSGKFRRVLDRLESPAVALALSPLEDRLAALTADGQFHLLDSRSLASEWTASVGWHIAAGRFVAFSPRGDLLVTTDPGNPRGLTVLDLLEKTKHRRLLGHAGLVLGASFSADGSLWTWGADGTVLTWDMACDRPVKVTRYAPQQRSSS